MKFSYIDNVFDPILGRKVIRWVLELPGAGCEWYKNTGGCTMCGFNRSTQKYTFGGHLYPHWIFMLIFYYAYLLVRQSKPEILVIYNGGSFLSNREIPSRTQLAILRFVKNHPTILKVMVETRAEFIIRPKLEEYKKAIGGKKLEIAIGLESADDHIRNECLRKGLSKKVFERAIALCRDHAVSTFAYVFLKPESLSDEEAIDDAVASIKYCAENLVDEVSLSCAFVQEGTPLHLLFKAGLFTPPTLWSIIEVVKRTAGIIPIRIGSFDDEPPPIARPYNCLLCNDWVMSAINQYREDHDLSVFDSLRCGCKK